MARQHSEPWADWIPGVLSRRQVSLLISEGFLDVEEANNSLDASSIDLTLSSEVYHLPEGTIKPSGARYLSDIRRFARRLDPMDEKGITLEARTTYLVKLRERLFNLKGSGINGQATAKSSVGRVDVLARLVVDGMDCYESFTSDRFDSGDLYLEITPLTFSVRIKPGISLSQLRLFYGTPSNCQITGNEAYKTFLKGSNGHDATLSVDLEPVTICGQEVVAFCAKETNQEPPVPLWKEAIAPAPEKYWNFVKPKESRRLTLSKGSFYILKSKELLALPSGVAVYCRAIDESFGEMRIHYAGFAHPWFGRRRGDGKVGTPLIFEVRGHDVNVSLQDGESMARLLFYRMSEDASEKDADPAYGEQELKLSKYFGSWPDKVVVDDSGTVQSAE